MNAVTTAAQVPEPAASLTDPEWVRANAFMEAQTASTKKTKSIFAALRNRTLTLTIADTSFRVRRPSQEELLNLGDALKAAGEASRVGKEGREAFLDLKDRVCRSVAGLFLAEGEDAVTYQDLMASDVGLDFALEVFRGVTGLLQQEAATARSFPKE